MAVAVPSLLDNPAMKHKGRRGFFINTKKSNKLPKSSGKRDFIPYFHLKHSHVIFYALIVSSAMRFKFIGLFYGNERGYLDYM